jgi:hypothetical protein
LAAAAEASDPAVKIRLLEGAASIAPDADDPKLALFDEAYRSKHYQTAIAAIYPLISRNGLVVPPEPTEEQYENPYYSGQFMTGAVRYGQRGGVPSLDTARRATLSRELADSYSNLNMPRDAAFYFQIAVQLDPADAESKARLSALQEQLERRRANRQRQPVITGNLEQDHPVRPRLGGGQ